MKQIRTAHICELIAYKTNKNINGIKSYRQDTKYTLTVDYDNGTTSYYDISTIAELANTVKEINRKLNEYRLELSNMRSIKNIVAEGIEKHKYIMLYRNDITGDKGHTTIIASDRHSAIEAFHNTYPELSLESCDKEIK